MTDNNIIKALECCNSTKKGRCLNECPYYNYSAKCSQAMIKDTLNLIKRQQAEIKKLQEHIQKCEKIEQRADELIAQLQKENDDLKRDAVPRLQNALERANKYGIELQKELKTVKSAADVVEVKHGENITKMNTVDEFICSECGLIMRDVSEVRIDEDNEDECHFEFEFKYCPNCGVKIKESE